MLMLVIPEATSTQMFIMQNSLENIRLTSHHLDEGAILGVKLRYLSDHLATLNDILGGKNMNHNLKDDAVWQILNSDAANLKNRK